MSRQWTHWMGWTVVAVIAADWGSKFLVQNRIALQDRVVVLENWLYLVHSHNRGIAFGMLNDTSNFWRTPVLVFAGVTIIVLLAQFARTLSDKWARLGVALIMGGALGNLGDRLINGGVTDFVLVRFFPFIFNIADAAITIGAILIALQLRAPDKARATEA